MVDVPRYSRNAWIAVGVALVWGLLLVVLAFVAPVYSTSSGSATDGTVASTTTEGTATLVGVNGYGVLLVVSVPLVAAVVVAWALARGRRRIGWVVTSLLGALNVLAMLSVGIFFLPVTIALVVACASTPRTRVARPADPAPLTA
ncbi:MAG: hypothetical protein M0Z98_10800 [Actinomycetales bacterium]|nr:hypothetical protein [Actinomycetales bacterium]